MRDPARREAVPGGELGSERGMALIIVLLGLALVLLVVGEFVQAVRLEAATTLNFRRAIVATQLAQAGYQRAVAEILADFRAVELDVDGSLAFRRSGDAAERIEAPPRLDIDLGGPGDGRLSYRITDETSRINLNRASADLLGRLVDTLGVERDTRDVIVDSVQDWRGPDEGHRLNGAKSDYYLALPVPYRSKNADFDDVEELAQVRGVTPAILRGSGTTPGLAELLTVAGAGAVNVNTVEAPVLRALGFADAEIELLVARRPYRDLAAVPPAVRRGSLVVSSDTFRIQAWGAGAGPQRTLVAVVQRRLAPDRAARVVVLSWRWLDQVHDQPARERGPGARPQSTVAE